MRTLVFFSSLFIGCSVSFANSMMCVAKDANGVVLSEKRLSETGAVHLGLVNSQMASIKRDRNAFQVTIYNLIPPDNKNRSRMMAYALDEVSSETLTIPQKGRGMDYVGYGWQIACRYE
jgi:hypothetical protein